MKFSESHEWIKIEKNIGQVGVTRHAQKELGEVVYIELPTVGKMVKAGEEVAVLESTKAAVDLYTPVSGEIVEINHSVKTDPNVLNQSPENQGWLFKIRLSELAELDALLNNEQYLELIIGK